MAIRYVLIISISTWVLIGTLSNRDIKVVVILNGIPLLFCNYSTLHIHSIATH